MNFYLSTRKFLKHLPKTLNLTKKRNFLTDNYYCYEQWDKFLLRDLVKNTGTINSFSIELNKKLDNNGLVTPLDMDILAAKLVHLSNFQELEFIENIFMKFRKTQSSLYVRDSFHYSFIRSYIDLNQIDRLLQVLKLKYKFGIFADSFTANMLMDLFIKRKDFRKAALTAHEILLQENNENELTMAASLFSCMKHIAELRANKQELESESIEENKKNEEEEKIKLLVYFTRKAYNDDHFDLKNERLLCGKTIYFASHNAQTLDSNLKNNLKVYGLLLFKKYNKAMELLEACLNKEKCLYKFLFDQLKESEEELVKNESLAEANKDFLQKWTIIKEAFANKNDKHLVDKNEVNELEQYLESVKKAQIPADIKSQTNLYSKWQAEQQHELNEQIRNVMIEVKRESILKRLNDLELQEELLTFFDKRQEIVNTYDNKGFPDENPSEIPIEPEESQFKVRFERHFKPWPKYANRPAHTLKLSEEEEYKLDSLRKVYLDQEKTTSQTS